MSDVFNPYSEWLGIPLDEQPPNHYRLLDIEFLESDLGIITDAVLNRTALLRQYQLSSKADYLQQLLGEIARAKTCLLNPEKKASYDARQQATNVTASPDDNLAESMSPNKEQTKLDDQPDEWPSKDDRVHDDQYYKNGQKKSDRHYKDGKQEGRWTFWYANGQKKSERYFRDGKLNGCWTEWYKNGQKKSERYYKDGKQEGRWYRWHEDGQPIKETYWINGKQVSREEF